MSHSGSRKKPKGYQHYIPRFILRRFLSPTDFDVYYKKQDKWVVRGASNSMGKDLFYEHGSSEPNEIEDLLATREGKFGLVINKILDGKTLSQNEFSLLIEFRHLAYYRSNEFRGFHTFKKSRGISSWEQRSDWRMLNGIYAFDNPNDFESAIKKSQLTAIKSVIDHSDVIFKLSMMAPVCFVFTSKSKKFMIGDSGSISFGGELDGITIIVISPSKALAFPKSLLAMEILANNGLNSGQGLLIHKDIGDDLVAIINSVVKDHSYEYYIQAR